MSSPVAREAITLIGKAMDGRSHFSVEEKITVRNHIVIALISASGCRPQIVRELTVEAVNHAKLINGQYVIKVSSQLMSDELI